MKLKKDQLTDSLTNFLLVAIYESKKLLTSFSIQQYLLYDYYHSLRANKGNIQKSKLQQRRIKKAFYYLRRAQYINLDNQQRIKLTNKGLYKAILFKAKQLKTNKSNSNSAFYIIIFDIPERYKHLRNLFRRILYHLGGELLQRSVFVLRNKSAYFFLKDLIKQSEIKNYVKIITATRLE